MPLQSYKLLVSVNNHGGEYEKRLMLIVGNTRLINVNQRTPLGSFFYQPQIISALIAV